MGDDGTRFIPEDDINRHGHRYNYGLWRIPLAQRHPYLIFDHKQYEELKAQPADDYHNHILSKVIQAATLDQLAEKFMFNRKPCSVQFKILISLPNRVKIINISMIHKP